MKKKFSTVNDLRSGLDVVRKRKSPMGLVVSSATELESGLQKLFGGPILNERDKEELREFAERETQKVAKRNLKLNTCRFKALNQKAKTKVMQQIRDEINKADIFRNVYEDPVRVVPARKLSAEREEDLSIDKGSVGQEYTGFKIRNLKI